MTGFFFFKFHLAKDELIVTLEMVTPNPNTEPQCILLIVRTYKVHLLLGFNHLPCFM